MMPIYVDFSFLFSFLPMQLMLSSQVNVARQHYKLEDPLQLELRIPLWL